MESYVVCEAEKDDCSTTIPRSYGPFSASAGIDDSPSLLLVNPLSSNLSGSLSASSDRLDLPLALHCGEDENSVTTSTKGLTYCRKWRLATDGVYVPTSTICDYLCECKDLELWSSGRSSDLQGGLKEKEENFIILIDSLDGENLPPLPGQVLTYQCEWCGKPFQHLHQLEEHKKKYVAGCSYWCTVCGKEFFRSANLRMHKMIHSTIRPHKCPECGKGFIRTADVWRHLQSLHKISRSGVVLGDANVRNPWSVLQQSQDQSCNSGQRGSAAQNPGEDSSEPHQCPVCCKAFSNANLLSKHQQDQNCNSGQRGSAKTQNPGEDSSKPYQCPMCCKAFSKTNLLSKHQVVHRKEKPYQCRQCSMAFVQLSRLKRHHQTHTGERPFLCKECGRAFTRLGSLQRHQRSHTGEKPYSCASCGQSFAESGTLRRHEGIHEIVQP